MRLKDLYFCLLGLCLLLVLSGCGSAPPQVQAAVKPKVAPTASPMPIPVSQPTTLTLAPRVDVPMHIRIPAIGVDTDLDQVGILPTGNLDTPQLNPWDNAGWYKDGTRPGEVGSAVIDGHVDRPGGGPAVFWNLRYMNPGDEIIITTHTGQQLHFQTIKRMAYAPSQAPMQDIFGNNSGKYLNLITCAGDWIPSEHQTSLRMVVFAKIN